MVYFSKIIHHFDCTFGTGFFAFFTADAGVFAHLSCVGTLVGVGAHYRGMIFSRNHGNDVLGAGNFAKTASDAERGVDMSDSVTHAYCVCGTFCGTVTEAEAST